jgi:hypothetical protein
VPPTSGGHSINCRHVRPSRVGCRAAHRGAPGRGVNERLVVLVAQVRRLPTDRRSLSGVRVVCPRLGPWGVVTAYPFTIPTLSIGLAEQHVYARTSIVVVEQCQHAS